MKKEIKEKIISLLNETPDQCGGCGGPIKVHIDIDEYRIAYYASCGKALGCKWSKPETIWLKNGDK
ncbi:hypothetical protein COT20_03040 [bacterium (Candidatus Gribaldobacteria) CG08_land_8_20_14_0_20_39_15]|uniref:Uncharacterized protein n=1 Tax=bacterium (Candidatus Gribaldobacteria) CG08_land_8_20_14_0_20_39_15 TaxID=2014273 RepID=A0A2M6XTW1_9BACT|nr:MAG: hypothetical protein COT20_03040 [bacterium (Candidatus Gribaldobacteria) CG08_land_8_20_14_0_20_39_15]